MRNFFGDPLVIRDIGPWNECPTVTNDAENLVKELLSNGRLKPGQRLYYYDSDSRLGEILIKDGCFEGFGLL